MSFETDDNLRKADPLASDPEAELRAVLSQFTLTFLKAVMMTGIYPPDHPVIANVAAEPYLTLKRLAPDSNEITFMTASAATGDEIIIEGVLTEGIPFIKLIHTSMGEVFAKKFIAYFERNRLVSFSIKTRISRAEFQKLISVFAERRVQEEESGGAMAVPFSDLLLQNGVLHATAMTREEIVGGERPLSWRVKMAISRLRKDLRLLPLYSKATSQELAQAKTMLVQDITRPLRQPKFLKDLLANTDLITAGVAELENVDVEREIIWCLHPGMLASVSWDIVGDLERASWGAIKERFGEVERRLDKIFKGLLKRMALRMRELEPEKVSDLLNYLFTKRILTFRELPETLQKELLVKKWTDQFLANSDAALLRFASLDNIAVYREYLNTFQEILPELIRRKRLLECSKLVKLLLDHSSGPNSVMPERASLASEALKRLAEPGVLDSLVECVESPEKEQRRLALNCVEALGERGIGRLLAVLASSKIAQVRRDVARTIAKMGEEAFVPIMEMLSDKTHEWYVYRNLLMLVADTRCMAAVSDVGPFLFHRHPRVREEAVRVLELLQGGDCVEQIVPLLQDPEPAVVRKVIRVLARFKARHPAFLEALGRILQRKREREAEVQEDLVKAAAEAVAALGPFTVAGRDVRDLLSEWLEDGSTGLRKLLKKSKPVVGEETRIAICGTLGAVGDANTIRKLSAAQKDPSPAVRQKALDAVETIQTRLAGGR